MQKRGGGATRGKRLVREGKRNVNRPKEIPCRPGLFADKKKLKYPGWSARTSERNKKQKLVAKKKGRRGKRTSFSSRAHGRGEPRSCTMPEKEFQREEERNRGTSTLLARPPEGKDGGLTPAPSLKTDVNGQSTKPASRRGLHRKGRHLEKRGIFSTTKRKNRSLTGKKGFQGGEQAARKEGVTCGFMGVTLLREG